ncbi:septum formation protein [Tamaricihabitans halophyticus]|uniref:Nucleoside triphosphate pyrophosphatase n=1 Tax=Tamaricihabitans halophyticus TaxID=1262583 RepID=A0A4R2R3I2_9PSEU|nr:Maf family nucleotide pyrophosphatase [Tamaricihabitans halophyticus]TCP56178.1 septum formation protein [Tamaricihabitans halophyticus]
MRFILASASPARLSLLRAAGIEPIVRVSGVDEDAVSAAHPDAGPAELVTALAMAKAEAVVSTVGTEFPDAVVVGCDSMLEYGGQVVGKAGSVEIARKRWAAMAGDDGLLHTGHAVVRLGGGVVTHRSSGARLTQVHFGVPDEDELAAYLATEEPLSVAGSFTMDGYGGWFMEGVTGDPSCVIGISLPLTRQLLGEVGVRIIDLWRSE